MNLKLMGRISLLEARIVDLQSQLARYQNPKNSGNSSIPPSKDENRPKKTQSLREDSERKPGGQPGHTGHTLEMNANPDVITDHIPGFCSCCGHDLSGISAGLSSKRQVIDLPIIRPVCTEHRSYHKTCPCGEKKQSCLPRTCQRTATVRKRSGDHRRLPARQTISPLQQVEGTFKRLLWDSPERGKH